MTPTSTPTDRFDGYVHVRDGRLVDGRGGPLLMRGVGLGNWLLPEGYMWAFDGGPQSPREIEALIDDLVGPDGAATFWAQFEDTFITDADVARIAAEGFDHIRLPINSRLVMDESGALLGRGLELVDRVIEWCRNHGLWVVLDLHGAPGGQTGTNIDDSPRGRPELFESEVYRHRTIELWRALAARYAAETVVAGYDLLNEPLPNEWQHLYPDRLVELYRDLTAAVREVDPDHLIIYEGTHWSTNWDIFTEVWDENSMLQFHKYWSPPDLPSIARFVEVGERLGLPIYMGEGGENNTDWLQTAFQLYEDSGISWNFWPWKKVGTRTSPCSVVAPAGWPDVVAYAAGAGPRPTAERAVEVLAALVDAMRLASCEYRTDVINALFRRAPLTIPGTGFGFRGPGHSYEAHAGVPLKGFRHDDAVTVRFGGGREEPDEIPFSHTTGVPRVPEEALDVLLADGDWVRYEVNLARAGAATVRLHGEMLEHATVMIDGDTLTVEDRTTTPWVAARLAPGRHTVTVGSRGGGLVIRRIEVELPWPSAN